MTATQNFLDPAILARLQGLSLKARLIVEGYMSGMHKSPYHGFSVEFAEHREYAPGDDLRYVDWKVFGRSDRVYLKQFEEETNFACHLIVDASESMAYQSDQAAVSKLEYARYVAAAFACLILKQQDAVGLVTVDETVRQLLRPSSQPSQLEQLCHLLEQTPARGETSLGPVLHDLAERIRKRGILILLSDLFDDMASLLLGLKHFRHRRHEVLVLQVIDPAEQDFPFRDPTLFQGLETPSEQMTDPRSLRRAYQQEFTNFLTDVQRGCRDLQMDYALLRTDQPLDVALTSILSSRLMRRVS